MTGIGCDDCPNLPNRPMGQQVGDFDKIRGQELRGPWSGLLGEHTSGSIFALYSVQMESPERTEPSGVCISGLPVYRRARQ